MMMEINLLPHREARRAADVRESIAVLILGLVVLSGAVFFMNLSVRAELDQAQRTVYQLEADVAGQVLPRIEPDRRPDEIERGNALLRRGDFPT